MGKAEEERCSHTFIQRILISTVKKIPIILDYVLILYSVVTGYNAKKEIPQGMAFSQTCSAILIRSNIP